DSCPRLCPFPTRRSADLIAHNPLLAIAGEAEVSLTFELTQTSSEHLRIAWEYWDGEVWRGFKSAGAGCEDAGGEVLDSTQGLTQDRKSTRLNSSHVKIAY